MPATKPTSDRSQEPFTPEQIDLLSQRVVDVLMRVNRKEGVTSGDVLGALGALRRIVEQAKKTNE